MNHYQSHELLSIHLTRRYVRVRENLRLVKSIIKFPFMCTQACSVGVGLVLKVSSIQVNVVCYKFLFFLSCSRSQNVVTRCQHSVCSFRLLI